MVTNDMMIYNAIDQYHKSHNAPVPYPKMHFAEQKCAHFCSEGCIVGYGTGALGDLSDWSIGQFYVIDGIAINLSRTITPA